MKTKAPGAMLSVAPTKLAGHKGVVMPYLPRTIKRPAPTCRCGRKLTDHLEMMNRECISCGMRRIGNASGAEDALL